MIYRCATIYILKTSTSASASALVVVIEKNVVQIHHNHTIIIITGKKSHDDVCSSIMCFDDFHLRFIILTHTHTHTHTQWYRYVYRRTMYVCILKFLNSNMIFNISVSYHTIPHHTTPYHTFGRVKRESNFSNWSNLYTSNPTVSRFTHAISSYQYLYISSLKRFWFLFTPFSLLFVRSSWSKKAKNY